jgi:CubicO group peptidase (beta-lactamase class C family)
MEMRNIYMKSALNIKPRHNPDEVVIYANSGFLIAGVMLETAASKSFENLMQEKLFQPAVIKHSWLWISSYNRSDVATIRPFL